jgi:tetratricopeptide (TPR) repeat protein
MAVNSNLTQRRYFMLFGISLTLLVCLLYYRVLGFEFLNYDDVPYIVLNPFVNTGLSSNNVMVAFSHFHLGNWYPVTWLSHMLDVSLFGLNPMGHHLTNVLFHIVHVWLVLLFFRLVGFKFYLCAIMATLFAVHPMHVESVAWIAERKNLLSTTFILFALVSYVRYTQTGKTSKMVWTALMMALGLMTKPMPVTLPFVLLLLDFYPLNRIPSQASAKEFLRQLPKRLWPLIREKLPLFGLTVAMIAIALASQQQANAMDAGGHLSLVHKVSNALAGYGQYFIKAFLPINLAIHYPHPGQTALLNWLAPLIFLLTMSIVAIRYYRSHPYLLVGWFWFVGTLVPVVGIVQVGSQAMGDRFAYVPYLGLFLAVVPLVDSCLNSLIGQLNKRTKLAALKITTPMATITLATLFATGLSLITYTNIAHWKNSVTVFQQALKATDPNYALFSDKRYTGELNIQPGLWTSYYYLGKGFAEQGNYLEAIAHLDVAVQLGPNMPNSHYDRGLVLLKLNANQQAIKAFRAALDVDPSFSAARTALDHLDSN